MGAMKSPKKAKGSEKDKKDEKPGATSKRDRFLQMIKAKKK